MANTMNAKQQIRQMMQDMRKEQSKRPANALPSTEMPTNKPTPVKDARKNVQDERSQLAEARQQLMVAKETRAKQMAEKAAKQAANKPPPVLPTPMPRPRPTTPMPPQKPMYDGTTRPAFNIGNDLPPIRNPNNISDGPEGAIAVEAPSYAGVVNKSPSTSSGGVTGGVANAVQGAVNKMPMPENVIKPFGMKRGGAVRNKPQTKFASGGSVSSASKRGDGIAQRGKTKGRMC